MDKLGSKTLHYELEPFSHGTTYTKHLEPYGNIINQGIHGKGTIMMVLDVV